MLKVKPILILLILLLCSCVQNGQINITAAKQSSALSVKINQSINETVGSCLFPATPDPTSDSTVFYKVLFSHPIDSSSFGPDDIENSGIGGTSALTWNISHCGDNRTFKLTASSIAGDGPITPVIRAGAVVDSQNKKNTPSTSLDNTVSIDTTAPSVNINQAITESVGTCTFNAVGDPTSSPGFAYRITFSEEIDPNTFDISDVINAGNGGGTTLNWTLANCGDNKNFKLIISAVTGNGTIIPTIAAGAVTDKAANSSLVSTAADNSITFSLVGYFNVSINQSVSETVGTCSFTLQSDPVNAAPFSYKVAFAQPIDPATFTTTDIVNSGTGGSSISWSITNCGDNTNFKLTATSVAGAGTIIPTLAASTVQNTIGYNNSSSTATDNTVSLDTGAPAVTINQAISETVGTCSFTAAPDYTSTAGFSFRVTFSEAIQLLSFTSSDILNNGGGGSTTLSWTLIGCGDNKNFKLTASSVTGDGSITPLLAAGSVFDQAGNGNTLSTAIDNTVVFDTVSPTVSINQATAETVGSCSFSAPTDPTNVAGFSYKVSFSEPINASSFTTADLNNAGTGGSITLTWALTNCGDDKNFKLAVSAASPDGSIIPTMTSGTVLDKAGNGNLSSSATDNSITYDTISPSVTVNQAVAETIGSCSFTATIDPTTTTGFAYRVTFSENIKTATFTTADIVNSGTGGLAGILSWTLTACGDNRNFKLVASTVSGDGTIVPNVALASVEDTAGNTNTSSTSTDNTITFDATAPSVTINQAITEIVGSCNFSAYSDPISMPGFSYRVRFSEIINTSTFTVSDITNTGTGGGSSLIWSLTDCGDHTNFKIVASAVNGNGTITPNLPGSTVKDLAGNNNTLSSSTDNVVTYTAGAGWYQEAYIKASNADAGDQFGYDVSASGDTLAVSTIYEQSLQTTITNGATSSTDNSGDKVGAVYVYKRTGSSWTQEAYLKASNAEDSDRFGSSVALQGDTLIVGAEFESSSQTTITNGPTSSADNSDPGGGGAYVYKRTGTTWAQEAYIKPSNSEVKLPDGEEFFGNAVTISGNTIAVSAVWEASDQTTITNSDTSSMNNHAYQSGAVYVYTRSGTIWKQEAYIKSVNSRGYAQFGTSVSLSGNSLAVGAPYESSAQSTITNGSGADFVESANYFGAAYIYTRLGTVWSQEAYIKVSNKDHEDYFANNVVLNGDTLAVSAPFEDSNLTTISSGTFTSADNSKTDSGAIFIFRRNAGSWSQEAFIKTINSDASDFAGSSLALNGNTLAVASYAESSNQTTITNGATASSDNTNAESGAVYVYMRYNNTWTQEAYFKASNNNSADHFGADLSLKGDTLIVAATGEDAADRVITNGATSSSNNSALDSGAVYVYRNLTRLFDPSDVYFSTSANSITLYWTKAYGATDYLIAYAPGLVAPANCASGTLTGNVSTYVLTSLSPDSTFSVRLCATNGITTTEGVSFVIRTNDSIPPGAALISRAVTETIGSCNFMNQSDTAYEAGFTFKVTFDEPINGSSFTASDISNKGTLNSSDISWDIKDCGDGLHYMIKASAATSSGTVIPVLAAGTFSDYWGNSNTTVSVDPSAVNFTFSGWYQEAYIKASNSDGYESFSVVALSGDTLAVGAPFERSYQTTITNGTSSSSNKILPAVGAVYVYKRSGTVWNQEAYIKASNAGANKEFGNNLDLYQDTLVVGAYNEDCNETTITTGITTCTNSLAPDSGATYVFKRAGSNWSQEAFIKASNSQAGDNFGISVSLDTDTIAVGSGEDSNQTIITNGTTSSSDNSSLSSGAVYIYKRTGTTWAQESFIKAPNNGPEDFFGSSVSINKDTLAVAASYEDSSLTTITNGPINQNELSEDSGAVYVYRRNGSSWSYEAYIKAANNDSLDHFGASIALDEDTLAISATYEASQQSTITNGATASSDNSLVDSGAVYVYYRTGSTWTQQAYIKASNPDEYDIFGNAVDLKGDTLIVGSTGESSAQTLITNGNFSSADNSIYSAGAIYVFKRTGSTWAQEAYIKASNSAEEAYFGSYVALSGDTIAVGASNESSNQSTITNGSTSSTDKSSEGSGAVYIYRNRSRLFDVDNLIAVSVSGNVTLSWKRPGGNGSGYLIAMAPNTLTAPSDCNSGAIIELASSSTTSQTYSGLPIGSNFSFRVCSYDGFLFSTGETITVLVK